MGVHCSTLHRALPRPIILLRRIHRRLLCGASVTCQQSLQRLDDPRCRFAVLFWRDLALFPLTRHQAREPAGCSGLSGLFGLFDWSRLFG